MTIHALSRGSTVVAALLLWGCSSGGSAPATSETSGNSNPETTAAVYEDAEFSIDVNYDVVYAQGLTHTDWNSPTSSPMDLLLDVYLPINNDTARPAMIFIHGGGFVGGDKGTSPATAFATYFAQRGFVGLSINYRLLGDYGTVPASFITAIDAIPDVTDENRDQITAMYPAVRDAKAAVRWLVAHADQYGVDPDLISIVGGSAGSFISIALGASGFDDYTHELTLDDDATLASTHLDESFIVASVVDHWGGPATVDLLEIVDGMSRWDSTDAPLSIVHGTEDLTVTYDQAEALVDLYTTTGAYFELATLEGAGHGAWNTTYNGQSLEALGFSFITRMLDLEVL